jgi:hypothetical protein
MELKDLLEQLDKLKLSLETTTEAKAKAAIEAEIKKLTDASVAKTAELEKEIADMKAANVVRDEADKKNQKALDDLIAKGGVPGAETKGVTLEDAIAKAITENEDEVQKFARRESKSLIIEMKDFLVSANVAGGSRYGQQFSTRGIIESAKRKVHVRDLMDVSAAGPGNTYTFMSEVGTGTGTEIAPTAEGNTKPNFDLNLREDTVNFEVIAGYTRITRKAMNNIPGFIGFLQSRLPEKLKRVEDASCFTVTVHRQT